MLSRTEQHLKKQSVGEKAELVHGDLLDHERPGFYDVVVANFFLNVFDEKTMPHVLAHLASLLREGGRLMVSDFRPLCGGAVHRSLQWAYHEAAIRAFSILTGNAIHPIYDYRGYFADLGLALTEEKLFPFFPGGPAWFQTLEVTKRSFSSIGKNQIGEVDPTSSHS